MCGIVQLCAFKAGLCAVHFCALVIWGFGVLRSESGHPGVILDVVARACAL